MINDSKVLLCIFDGKYAFLQSTTSVAFCHTYFMLLFLSLPPPIEKPECNSSHWPFNSALVPAPLPLVNPFITCFCTDAPLHVTGNVVKQQLTVCLPLLQTTEATVTVCQLQTKTDWNQTIHWSKCAFSIKDWYTHTHTHIYFSNWWSVLSIM